MNFHEMLPDSEKRHTDLPGTTGKTATMLLHAKLLQSYRGGLFRTCAVISKTESQAVQSAQSSLLCKAVVPLAVPAGGLREQGCCGMEIQCHCWANK